MEIFLFILMLLAGFVLLIKGADFFVDGASALAIRLKVPSFVVGLTIVAMGTSAPELAISTSSAIAGKNELAISNVIGSNIFNVAVVLGICAIIKALGVEREVLRRDYPVVIAISALFIGYIAFTGGINRVESIIFLVLMVGYMLLTIKSALKSRKNALEQQDDEEEQKPFVAWKVALFIIGGAAAIVFGGNWVVYSASKLGAEFGMSDTIIGLTICAIGTSLPELVTSVVATRKGETDMAIGNVIGSNIFNILLILGVSMTIRPYELADGMYWNTLIDGIVCGSILVMSFIFSLTGKRINRAEGATMLACYIGYMAYTIVRETALV